MTATLPHIETGDQEWRDSALCRQTDPEIFFPEKGGDNGETAKRVCSFCDVSAECLADALRRPAWADQHGVRGGLSPRERAKVRKRGQS